MTERMMFDMGVFNRLNEPVFLKESSNTEEQIERLKNLQPYLNQYGKTLIKQDIKDLECGMFGEKQIAFELKNSHIPMYILLYTRLEMVACLDFYGVSYEVIVYFY